MGVRRGADPTTGSEPVRPRGGRRAPAPGRARTSRGTTRGSRSLVCGRRRSAIRGVPRACSGAPAADGTARVMRTGELIAEGDRLVLGRFTCSGPARAPGATMPGSGAASLTCRRSGTPLGDDVVDRQAAFAEVLPAGSRVLRNPDNVRTPLRVRSLPPTRAPNRAGWCSPPRIGHARRARRVDPPAASTIDTMPADAWPPTGPTAARGCRCRCDGGGLEPLPPGPAVTPRHRSFSLLWDKSAPRCHLSTAAPTPVRQTGVRHRR